MKRVIVNFDESSGMLIFPDGTQYCTTVKEFEEAPKQDVLSLVKAGLSAEDLINLKKADLL